MSVYKQYFERRNPELRSFTCTLQSILSRPGSWLKEKMWIWQALYRLSGARSIYHGQIIEGLKSIYMQMEYWITNQSLKNSFQEFWELQDLLLSQFLLPLLVTKKKKKSSVIGKYIEILLSFFGLHFRYHIYFLKGCKKFPTGGKGINYQRTEAHIWTSHM